MGKKAKPAQREWVMRVSSAEEGAGEEGSAGKDAKMPASITSLTAAP